MQLTQLLDNDTLLTYALSTSPSPLQVSPQSGPPSTGILTFVISCPVSIGQVTVTQIAFNLPIGDPKNPDSSDLAETATGISPSVSSSGSDTWSFSAGATTGSFILKPASGKPTVIDSQGLTVTFVGIQVGPIVGTATINITELATADNTAPQPRLCNVAVPKFPYGVTVGNFSASAPMIQHGADVTLSWVGSVGPDYTLFWAQQSQDVSKFNQWTSPDLTDTTTFILEAVAQEGGQTVKIQYSLTVIVADPDITATTINVLQTSALQGNVAIGTNAAAANLSVNGTSTLATVNAGTLGVTGGSNLASLAVSGATSLQTLAVSGVSALAATTAASLNIGQWTISVDNSGNLNFSNGNAMFQLGATGTVACGNIAAANITLNGYQVISDQSPISIFSPTWNSFLNGSSHFGGGCNGFDAAAYWMDAGYPPDGDSNLQIRYGNPF